VTADVISRKAHFGVGRSSLVLDFIEGKSVYLLSAIYQHSPFMLLSKKREDLKEVRDLRGKKVMLTDDLVSQASLTAMLRGGGIKRDSFIKQKHSFNIYDLVSCRTDANEAYISN
jgi:polar amino acid transport system substrate-binding protein